jgi:hypothetical protein
LAASGGSGSGSSAGGGSLFGAPGGTSGGVAGGTGGESGSGSSAGGGSFFGTPGGSSGGTNSGAAGVSGSATGGGASSPAGVSAAPARDNDFAYRTQPANEPVGSQYAGAVPGGASMAGASAGGARNRQGTAAYDGNDSEGFRPQAATPLRPGEWVPPEPRYREEPKREEDPRSKKKNLADRRGENWALPDATRGAAAVRRTIHVECQPSGLTIVPEPGLSGKAVPFGNRTEESVDAMVSAVWEYMKSWGIAGRGMYWRPVLRFHVAPGAELRYAEIKALLGKSGLEVRNSEVGD